MKTKIIEATNGPLNWGKFMLGRFDEEWRRTSAIPPMNDPELEAVIRGAPLLQQIGLHRGMLLVLDLQTREGAVFSVKRTGFASADLEKHKIWVCPLFEPFLTWLYQQDVTGERFDALPAHVDLAEAPFAVFGYRRSGKVEE